MRQLAIAEQMLGQGHEVSLLSNMAGPQWLEEYVGHQAGLGLIQVAEGCFEPDVILRPILDALLIDSYQVSQSDIIALEERGVRVALMIDGPWQDISGNIAIAPVLDGDAAWLQEPRRNFKQFHFGPSFIPLRQEITRRKNTLSSRGKAAGTRRVVISLGGNATRLEELILSAVLRTSHPCHFDVFFEPNKQMWAAAEQSSHTLRAHARGSAFLDLVAQSDVVIAAAGSSAAELLYLGIPTMFVPIAANQSENAESITRLNLGPVLWPSSLGFEVTLQRTLSDNLGDSPKVATLQRIIDGQGSARIANVLAS